MNLRYEQWILFALGGSYLLVLLVLNFNGLYGQDSYEYARYAEEWRQYWVDGRPPGDYHWPLNFPVLGSLLAYFTGLGTAMALQVISVFALTGSAILILRSLRLLYPSRPGHLWWVLLAFFFAPFIYRTGAVVMSDQLAAFFLIAAFYCVLLIVRRQKAWMIPVFALSAGLAVMTRYNAALLLLPMAIYLLPQLKYKRSWLPSLVALAFLVLPFIPHYLIRQQEVLGFISHGAILKWSVGNMFSRTFEQNLGHFHYLLPNILYVGHPFFHPGFIFFGLPLWFFFKRISLSRETLLLLALIVPFLLFTAGIDTQNDRYFVIVMPFVALLLFPLFRGAIEWLEDRGRNLGSIVFGAFLVIQIGLAGYAFSKPYQANQEEQVLARLFAPFSDMTVYTYGTEQALSYYQPQNEYISLHEQDGLDPEGGTYLLFHNRWPEHPQMKDLFPIKLQQRLAAEDRLIARGTQGDWTLYAITKAPSED